MGKVYWIDNSLEDSNEPVPHAVKRPGLKVSWDFCIYWVTGGLAVQVPGRCPGPTAGPSCSRQAASGRANSNSPTDELPAKTLDF